MKLSEMNTEQLADALCSLVVPMSNIAKDEQFSKSLSDVYRTAAERKTPLQQAGELFNALIPALLGRHRADSFAILSALTGKTTAEIEKQPGFVTIQEIREAFDKELIDFFKPSGS